MTPQDFIAKWRHVELKERTTSQSHFNDLCRLLGVDDPVSPDPKSEWFTDPRKAENSPRRAPRRQGGAWAST